MSISIATMRAMPSLTTALAMRPGGVDVVGADGRVAFRLCIPSKPLREPPATSSAEIIQCRKHPAHLLVVVDGVEVAKRPCRCACWETVKLWKRRRRK